MTSSGVLVTRNENEIVVDSSENALIDQKISDTGCYDDTIQPKSDIVLPTPQITLFPAKRVQLGWREGRYTGAGMRNDGNTCYLNSTLQALFHVPAFVNWLESESSHLNNCTVIDGEKKGECIICAMHKTFRASQMKSGGVIIPFLIYRKLKYICSDFEHGQQQDAHEFMGCLLDSMVTAYLTRFKDSKLDHYSRETTPIHQIFGGYIRTEVACFNCGGTSTQFQHCQDLLLDIESAATLDDALKSYFRKEHLASDSGYRCEQCNKLVATKKCYLEKPPRVLCILYKRFNSLGEKINKHVKFSQKLDITKFLFPHSAHYDPIPATYHLVALVTHIGSSVHHGHYIAVAENSAGVYYEFDDKAVRCISLSDVLNSDAYMLLYECEPCVKTEVPSTSQQKVASATTTTATCAVNEEKPDLAGHRQTIQGPIAIPEYHRNGHDMNKGIGASPLLPANYSYKLVWWAYKSSESS